MRLARFPGILSSVLLITASVSAQPPEYGGPPPGAYPGQVQEPYGAPPPGGYPPGQVQEPYGAPPPGGYPPGQVQQPYYGPGPGQQPYYGPGPGQQPYYGPPPQAYPDANNVFYGELLGNGGIYSLNYERMVLPNVLGIRVGFSFISLSASSDSSSSKTTIVTVPLMVNYIGIGNDRHHLEIGGGVLLLGASATASGAGDVFSANGFGAAGTASFGYRLQPRSGGLFFKLAFTPLFGRGGFLPWGGMSFGFSF